MQLDFATVNLLRQHNAAWRLLRSDHAPLIISFLHFAFAREKQRMYRSGALVEKLDDLLYALRANEENFPREAIEYLNEWASAEKGWLRKFYAQDGDEACFELSPAAEKVLTWVEGLQQQGFIGTESRLLTLFDLLKQIQSGSETNPQRRLDQLRKERQAIDREIERVLRGDIAVLSETEIKERFLQFSNLARELLADFKALEANFRQLDRDVREKVARWEGPKGPLLAEIMGERDALSDSDQGRSFRAFWDFLLSPARQEELATMLQQVFALPAVQSLKPDERNKKLHYDWLDAAEHTQHMVAALSQQLRRFLDDQAWLENRRIMQILQKVESHALDLRQQNHAGFQMTLELPQADLDLCMERPLFSPTPKLELHAAVLELGESLSDSEALYSQVYIDRELLKNQIRFALASREQVSLGQVCAEFPLQQGLAELIAYLQLAVEMAAKSRQAHFALEETEVIAWQVSLAAPEQDEVSPIFTSTTILQRQVKLPRVTFFRSP